MPVTKCLNRPGRFAGSVAKRKLLITGVSTIPDVNGTVGKGWVGEGGSSHKNEGFAYDYVAGGSQSLENTII